MRRDFQEKPLGNTQGFCCVGVLLSCFLKRKCEIIALKELREAIVIGPWLPVVVVFFSCLGYL